MYNDLTTFQKHHKYLVAIDSDGCVFDTMTIKHQRFFYPLLEKQLGLEKWNESLTEKWEYINLYSKLRGINRFLGVYHLFQDLNDEMKFFEPKIMVYNHYIEHNKDITIEGLLHLLNETNDDFVADIINWSSQVNSEIDKHMPVVDPFVESVETIKYISSIADVAIVSSANEKALKAEWGHAELLDYVSVLTSQNDGSKEAILKTLISKGYDSNHVIMIGDSNGDRTAAFKNNAKFRLIEASTENNSWINIRQEFIEEGVFK